MIAKHNAARPMLAQLRGGKMLCMLVDQKLREGIVDYEKIKILKARASGRQLRDLDALLRTFVGDPDYSKRNYDQMRVTEAVHKGLRMLEALSNSLRSK